MTKLRKLQLESERRVAQRKRERAIFWTLAAASVVTIAGFTLYVMALWRG